MRVRRDADGTGDVRGVAVAGLHEPVIVPRREEHHFLRFRRLHDLAGIRAHARAPRQDAQVQRFQHRERVVRSLDEEHGLPGLNLLTVIQRVHDQLVPALGAELQDRDRLVDAAEIGVRFA